jgi:hypothetical protein
MMPFFWDGRLTPDAYKALILQLDPDDDEKEQKIRMDLERRTDVKLRRAFRDMMDTLYPEGWGGFVDPQQEARRVADAYRGGPVRDVLSRALQDGADLGVSVVVDQMQNVGFAFDWTLASADARDWALAHTDTLLDQLGSTSQRVVAQAIGRWIDNGEPLPALIKDLTPIFGRRRSSLISATEVTRAYAQGAIISYQRSGLIGRSPNETIPKHPGCRCWWSLQQNNSREWVYIFNSSLDERVCPQCGPLHGTEQ